MTPLFVLDTEILENRFVQNILPGVQIGIRIFKLFLLFKVPGSRPNMCSYERLFDVDNFSCVLISFRSVWIMWITFRSGL